MTDAPRVQYARTRDGFSIAFTVTGSGPPLVYMPQPLLSALQARPDIAACRAFDRRLEQAFQVIRYDSRGCGLSTRKIESLELDALVSDVEAIVDQLQLEEYFIWAEFDGGPPAIALAHRHGERVKKLVLWCSWARSQDILDKDAWLALNQLIEQNLRLYLETVTQGLVSGTGLDPRELVESLMPSIDQKSLRIGIEGFWRLDTTELLSEMKCPCLIMHRQGLFFPLEQSTRLAAAIPNGRLIAFPGAGGFPWTGDTAAVVEALEAFLLPDGAPYTTSGPSALRTVLFTDLVGHTAMMQRLGDEHGILLS